MKSIIVLSNDTELFSGAGTVNAIQQVTVTQAVNSEENLTVGSVCAAMLEATILTPGGGLSLAAGEEITLYKVQDNIRRKVGIFILEKPTKTSANSMKLTAFDRITKLDKDLSLWLAGLDAWPYRLMDLARMVCTECGVALENEEIPNGDFPVQWFSADGITGRDLIRWIGQAAGRFCIATADGNIRFDWYRENTKTIGGDYWYYQGGLKFEDYSVEKIAKVQIRKTADDIGTFYPDTTGNTYVIEGNPLLAALDAATLLPVAQTLYAQLKAVAYTPCKVTIPANLEINAGDIVAVTDTNGKTVTMYVMTKSTSGNRDTLDCTGTETRESTMVVNNKTLQQYMGKVLNLKMDVDGVLLQVEEELRSLEIGGRNLIRNSRNLIFEDYGFGLPRGYTKLDYIETTGTQYIDTGFVPNQDSRIVCEFMYKGGNGIYGARTSTASNNFALRVINSAWQPGYSILGSTSVASDKTNWHVADQNKNVFSIDGEVAYTFTPTTFMAPKSIILGGINAGSVYYGQGRYRACQIYDKGVLVRNLIPCRRADGTIGMFEALSSTFYGNAGTGEFVAGAVL